MVYKFLISAFVLVLSVFSIGCDTVSHSAEHAEVEGLVLTQGSTQLVDVTEAVVTGSLTVNSGATSSLISIEWRDADGDEVHGDDLGDEFTLGWVISDESIVTVNQSGRFGITLTGLSAGQTTIRIQLKHNDHPDFTTPDITVNVLAVS